MEDDVKIRVQLIRKYGEHQLPWEVVLVSSDDTGVLLIHKTLAAFQEYSDAQQYVVSLPENVSERV